MILDTCFIIDLLNNQEEAVKKAQELDKKNSSLFTTSITVFEIWQGIADLKDQRKLEKINILLEKLGLLNFDQESAKIGGKIHSELYLSGKPIQPEDSMIAGICIKNGQKLLTRNIKHFERVKELEVEIY